MDSRTVVVSGFIVAPVLVAGAGAAAWIEPGGEPESLSLGDAARRLEGGPPPLVCHAGATASRLGTGPIRALDLLELFAFAHPARFCLPTPGGLAQALDLPLPGTQAAEARSLAAAAAALLAGLAEAAGAGGLAIAGDMAEGGWTWGPAVLAALADASGRRPAAGLHVWNRLPEWQERPPGVAPGNLPVDPGEARDRLALILGGRAEDRPQQSDYAAGAAAAFAARERAGEPRFVLAEAGTGVGKTIGYIAPASVWAEKNAGAVWISTYTRNLQRQLDAEMDRLYPDSEEKNRKVVVRKGRENYLCLLNFDEAVGRLGPGDAVALGLMARWAGATRDGDMVGGDFPAWLADMLGARLTLDLTDTRGECIYSACRHYAKCFIERSIRRARRAEMVIANHALVMIQAALGDEGSLPVRYVFDEGHHLFDAADSAFSAHLTGAETADLRRWIIGEGRRSRGLALRTADLLGGNDAARQALDEALKAAQALPGPGWRRRLAGEAPRGTAEAFFAHVRRQVYARSKESPYSLETETEPPIEGLSDAAAGLDAALARLEGPLGSLIGELGGLLDDGADELDTPARNSIEALCRGLERRGILPLKDWRAMLRDLGSEAPPEFVDWFGVERIGGGDVDIGLHRHWVDPLRPFAEAVAEVAHGLLVTSATLTDPAGDGAAEWAATDLRTGARHMEGPVERVAQSSPFDHAGHTRVLVVGDVARDDADQVAAAYRELFKASGGGALGLFTAATRLKAVHGRIARPLDEAGLQLLAQHVDAMDTGTLIDIFRAEEDACLLGTDAVRDGVDVPGRSLRLIVFDRVPWPRPDILHRTRRQAFGGRAYDEMLTRLRLKQAYGRLLRRSSDRGVFVMLDRALPSRLATAFPAGVEVRRLGLKDAIAETRAFLFLDGSGLGGL